MCESVCVSSWSIQDHPFFLTHGIADRDPEEVMDGEKVEDIIVYINRLSTAKKRVDKRISTLSGEQFDFVSHPLFLVLSHVTSSH